MSFPIFSSPTPSTPHTQRSYKVYDSVPMMSSPLASSSPLQSPTSSPVSAAQERRRSHHHSGGDGTSSTSRHRISIKDSTTKRRLGSSHSRSANDSSTETPHAKLLRERFRAQCLDRAVRDRERKIRGRRGLPSEPSSDMECDDDADDEEDFLDDELFRRIMNNVERKRQHSYSVSYSWEVGSSYDPAMEEGAEETTEDTSEVPLADYDDDELEALAAEQELLEGVDPDEIFSLSDMDEPPPNAVQEDDHNYESDDSMFWTSSKGKGKAFTSFDDDDIDMDL